MDDLFYTDEKEKYDPVAFRDKIFQLIDQAGTDLEQVSDENFCMSNFIPVFF